MAAGFATGRVAEVDALEVVEALEVVDLAVVGLDTIVRGIPGSATFFMDGRVGVGTLLVSGSSAAAGAKMTCSSVAGISFRQFSTRSAGSSAEGFSTTSSVVAVSGGMECSGWSLSVCTGVALSSPTITPGRVYPGMTTAGLSGVGCARDFGGHSRFSLASSFAESSVTCDTTLELRDGRLATEAD